MFYVDASTNRIGIGTDTPGSVFHIVGNTKIENNASYFADTLAAVNSTAMALNISPTRASVTKCIAMGAIGSIHTHTGLQAYDSSDNSANNFNITPYGGFVGIGTSTPTSMLQINQSDSTASQAHFTNSTTGTAISDGLLVGISSNEEATIWNRENTSTVFATKRSFRR